MKNVLERLSKAFANLHLEMLVFGRFTKSNTASEYVISQYETFDSNTIPNNYMLRLMYVHVLKENPSVKTSGSPYRNGLF